MPSTSHVSILKTILDTTTKTNIDIKTWEDLAADKWLLKNLSDTVLEEFGNNNFA